MDASLTSCYYAKCDSWDSLDQYLSIILSVKGDLKCLFLHLKQSNWLKVLS